MYPLVPEIHGGKPGLPSAGSKAGKSPNQIHYYNKCKLITSGELWFKISFIFDRYVLIFNWMWQLLSIGILKLVNM